MCPDSEVGRVDAPSVWRLREVARHDGVALPEVEGDDADIVGGGGAEGYTARHGARCRRGDAHCRFDRVCGMDRSRAEEKRCGGKHECNCVTQRYEIESHG